MTRTPVRTEAPANELPFPLNIRMMVAGWKLLYFREGAFTPDPAKPEAWNRGAYLAEGLGHCGACHSPRNALGAVDDGRTCPTCRCGCRRCGRSAPTPTSSRWRA
ncbi:cytochrome c [Azospirillum sp. OGB3]|uniref:cytochrome c n=1 Tax=Azospirillum sp. OGB3 TaxID=2587012 RepID=UPI001B3C0B2A|nr:cytochrome c [Azospirillum sp. OGB3]